MSLQPYQQRVVDEATELTEKVDKLQKFIQSYNFNRLDTSNKELLNTQSHHMTEYLSVLRKRIEQFKA